MKLLNLILSLAFVLLFFSCNEDSPYLTFEIDSSGDTINKRDENGRQGRWVQINGCSTGPSSFTKSAPDSLPQAIPVNMSLSSTQTLFEIGYYVNNKKQGLWTEYSPDSTINGTFEYKDDIIIRN